MRNKIKVALQQGHKNLGLSEEEFERVAAFIETFVTEESGIDAAVNSEATLNLLKSYQSIGDRIRNKHKNDPKDDSDNKPKEEPKADPEVKPEPAPAPAPLDADALRKIIGDLVTESLKPLSDKFAKFEQEANSKTAVKTAEELFRKDGWVGKYESEANESWERAMELYAYNQNWTAEELCEKAKGYFSKAVKARGGDISKPFKSEGAGDENPDFSSHRAMLEGMGIDFGSTNS